MIRGHSLNNHFRDLFYSYINLTNHKNIFCHVIAKLTRQNLKNYSEPLKWKGKKWRGPTKLLMGISRTKVHHQKFGNEISKLFFEQQYGLKNLRI